MSYRLGWATDTHFDFVSSSAVVRLGKDIAEKQVDALLITGDISNSFGITKALLNLSEGLNDSAEKLRLIFFILGNHDFYGGSIDRVRTAHTHEERLKLDPHCVYLTVGAPISLSKTCALVGEDGWYDGANGNYASSDVALNDFFQIEELREAIHSSNGVQKLLETIQRLSNNAAGRARRKLETALANHKRVIFATHVPPFALAAWHEGKTSEPNFLPFFSCKVMGDMLLETMANHPDHEMLVLCGHCHFPGTYDPTTNIRVITGGAVYGHPKLNKVIEIDDDGWQLLGD